MKKGDKTFYGDPDDWEEEEEGEEEDLGFASKVRRSKRALGLREDEPVTEEEVKQAFRKQALKYHPDRYAASHCLSTREIQ
jgi:DnaJ-class molecular chaperone